MFESRFENRCYYKFISTENAELKCFGAGFSKKTFNKRDAINFDANNYCLTVILSGSGCLIDCETSEKFNLERGDYFQIFPGRHYSLLIDNEQNWQEFFVSVPKLLFELIVATNGIRLDEVCGSLELNESFIERIDEYVSDLKIDCEEKSFNLLPETCALITYCTNYGI